MTNLTDLTLVQARKALQDGECSAIDLTKAHIKNMEDARKLNAVILETPEQALKMAEQSDKRLKNGEAGLLEGLPIGVKDLFCTEGIRTTAGSKMLNTFIPPYESTVTKNLWQAGAVHLGKLNNDEFAMGSSNETSHFGAVINPWKRQGDNVDLVPGGSSGGSAAAVAAHIGIAATATDTGGSIRQPAGFTGTVGLKPSYGRCSRWGIIAFASSLDQAGPITRNVEDAALMLEVMASYDEKDTTSVEMSVSPYHQNLQADMKGKKIGIPKEYRVDNLTSEIESLWQKGIEALQEAGAEIVDISLPHTKYALPTYYIIAPAEASSNLSRYDGVRYGERVEGKDIDDMYALTRAQGFGEEVRRRVMIGTYVLSAGYYDAYYLKSLKVRRLIAEDFSKAYENSCDFILTPVTPSAAFALGDNIDDPVSMYLNDIFTIPVNLAGLPAISIPVGLNRQGLPLNLQLIGQSFGEESLLQAAYSMEQVINFQAKPEQWWR